MSIVPLSTGLNKGRWKIQAIGEENTPIIIKEPKENETPPVYRCGIYTPKFPPMSEPYLEAVKLERDTLLQPIFPKSIYDELNDEFNLFFNGKERLARFNIPHKRAVLLTGPPGNGKTKLIRALLTELCQNKYNTYGFDLTNGGQAMLLENGIIKWTERMTYDDSKHIFIIEDFDEVVRYSKKSFLNALEGISGRNNIMIIASTNHPERIDEAFYRPGRFDRMILIPLPVWPIRQAILKAYFVNTGLQPDISEAEWSKARSATEGMSGAYLYEIFKRAVANNLSLGEACKDIEEYFKRVESIINYKQEAQKGQGLIGKRFGV